MTDIEHTFGYNNQVPENIRETLMRLCQDVAVLQSKWDFYLELFSKQENAALLSELALWSFKIVEGSLRNDMTMAICRLGDPSVTRGKRNLSLATLVEYCPNIQNLSTLLTEFQKECKPISKLRNKHVGHKDFNTVICPTENPLPGIKKSQIDKVLALAEEILRVIYHHYTQSDLYFHITSRGDAKKLIFWLKAGQKHHSRG